MRSVLPLALTALLVGACADAPETPVAPDLPTANAPATVPNGFGKAGAATYAVTVENLTSTQPLTPPAAVVHRKGTDLFTVGEPASAVVQGVAENGDVPGLVMAASADKHVADVQVGVSGGAPPLEVGETVTFEVHSERGARYLSMVAMLICTNDGFTGVDALRLPDKVGESVTVEAAAYDAGTEINTEDFADLVPPCQALTGAVSGDAGTGMSNPALAEGGVIHHHPGIQGIDDLDPALYDWTDPVARITVERVN